MLQNKFVFQVKNMMKMMITKAAGYVIWITRRRKELELQRNKIGNHVKNQNQYPIGQWTIKSKSSLWSQSGSIEFLIKLQLINRERLTRKLVKLIARN